MVTGTLWTSGWVKAMEAYAQVSPLPENYYFRSQCVSRKYQMSTVILFNKDECCVYVVSGCYKRNI
jgi:hypothetical protein